MRINFKSGVTETLYKQAGARCSVPRCKNPTSGPFYHKSGAVNMGVACHIYSAAKNGPRGQGKKDKEFISSERNGIWCCQYHGALIDKDNGSDYSTELLFAWKELAEARVRKQMNDLPSPLGWVESIELTNFQALKLLPKIKLSRYSLIWGKHNSGKTSLLEIAASVTNSKFADRFQGTKRRDADDKYHPVTFAGKVVYSTVDYFEKEIFLEICGTQTSRKEGLRPCLLPPGDLEVIYCSSSESRKLDGEDDVDFLMRVLNIDKSALHTICNVGAKAIMPGDIRFVQSSIYDDEDDKEYSKYKENGDPHYNIEIRIGARDFFVSYDCLSGSEKDRLILDLMVAKAREVCKERLTLLLIEDLCFGLDENNFANLLRVLEKENFQSVVSVPPVRERDVLEISEGFPTLNNEDYLEKWRLAIVGDGQ
jgi:hypothetical protein